MTSSSILDKRAAQGAAEEANLRKTYLRLVGASLGTPYAPMRDLALREIAALVELVQAMNTEAERAERAGRDLKTKGRS